jgi:hypothetical protein
MEEPEEINVVLSIVFGVILLAFFAVIGIFLWLLQRSSPSHKMSQFRVLAPLIDAFISLIGVFAFLVILRLGLISFQIIYIYVIAK